MEVVVEWVLNWRNDEGLALAGVELYQPFPLPFTNVVDILLEEKVVLAWSYIFLYDTVTNK